MTEMIRLTTRATPHVSSAWLCRCASGCRLAFSADNIPRVEQNLRALLERRAVGGRPGERKIPRLRQTDVERNLLNISTGRCAGGPRGLS